MFDPLIVECDAKMLVKLLEPHFVDHPINFIKTLRELTNLSLKEARDLSLINKPKYYVKTLFGLDGYGPGLQLSKAFTNYSDAVAFRLGLDPAYDAEIVSL